MALDENGGGNNGMVMPVQPMGYGGGYGGGYGYPMAYPAVPVYGGYGTGNYGGDGLFGGDGFGWLLILFLFGMMGGWGGFGGFGGMGLGGMMGGANLMMWPWLMTQNTDNLVTAGFSNAGLTSTLSGIQSGITSGFSDTQLGIAGVNQNISATGAGIQNSLCNGFAGVNQNIAQTGNSITAAVTNGFAQAEIANNARQMADMQQNFASQTAITQGLNTIAAQQSDCCCKTREAIAAANAANLSEHCQDRYDAQRNTTDIITNATGNTQSILNAISAGIQGIQDKLCQQEIDALKTANGNLQTQLAMKDLAASQAAQTAALIADNTAQTQYVVNRVAPYPIPAYPVSNPYGYGYNYNNCCCGTNNGCGCNG